MAKIVGKLFKGGSWLYGPDNCRSAYHLYYDSDDDSFSGGFRLLFVRVKYD